jgi:hypothetical protein
MTGCMRNPLVLSFAVLLASLAGACHGTEPAEAPPPSVGTSAARPPAPSKMDDLTAPQPAQQAASAPAAEPSGATYDLAADRERRARLAKEQLGPHTVTTVISDIFVVIGPPGWQGGAFESSVSLMRSSMAGYMNNRFGKKPSQAISVYLFPEARGYEGFCKKQYDAPCIAHYGFYQPGDRNMVMNIGLGLGTLTHEIVHPLVEADFPEAPTWLNEGIASVFEAPVITKPGEIHGVKNWRHPRLKRGMTSAAEKDHARLSTLFGMSDEVFRGDDEDLHYSLARYVCQWLDERGKLWPFYQRWRDTVATDPSGEVAFKEVVGMTPLEANVPWSKWTLAL